MGQNGILVTMAIAIHRAILATRIYEPEGSAAAFRLAALVRAMDDSGYQTTILTTRSPGQIRSARQIRRWPVLRDRSGAVRGYLQYASFDIPLFFRLLFSRSTEVVIVEPPPTTGVAARLACWIRRTPYVYFAADVSSVAASDIGVNPLVVGTLRRVESWVLRGAAIVLAVSEGVRVELAKLGVPQDRIVVVGTGIDTDVFSRAGDARAQGHPYLVYAGNMSEIQGAGIFVEAFARVAHDRPTAQLMMFGQGADAQRLMQLANELAPGRIEFPGVIPGQVMAAWLRGAHAGLASMAPGGRYEFAFATKALASLSCGSPVIYAGEGVTSGLIRDNHLGWSVGWDIAEVAHAMDSALSALPSLSDRDRYSAWVAEHYSSARVAANAVEAIDRVMVGSA